MEACPAAKEACAEGGPTASSEMLASEELLLRSGVNLGGIPKQELVEGGLLLSALTNWSQTCCSRRDVLAVQDFQSLLEGLDLLLSAGNTLLVGDACVNGGGRN